MSEAEPKRVEEKEYLARLIYLSKYANDFIILLDDNFCFLETNERVPEFYGYTRDELIGMHATGLRAPETKAFFEEQISEAIKTGKALYETIHQRKDGTKFPVEINIHSIFVEGKRMYQAVIRDITERKRAENLLKESERRLKTIIHTSIDGFWITDLQGNLKEVNDAYCRMIGYSRDELLKMRISDFEAIEKPEYVAAHIKRIIETGSDRFETKHRRKDGTVLDIEISVNYMKADADLLAVFARDITVRKQAEDEIKILNTELEKKVIERTAQLQNTNQELESFSYSVSHDLQAPLRSIEGFSRALLEDYADKLDEQGKDYLCRVNDSTRHMTELINDLLKLSRITRTPINKEEIDLSSMFRAVAAESKSADPERKMELVVPEGIKAWGDPHLLKIVISNLVNNAFKFTSPHPAARIEFGSGEKEEKRFFFVRDDGVGFNPNYISRLFTPFQRLHTEEEFTGNGIGLATVRRIILRHGGEVWAEGGVGAGATFYFSLPAS